MKRAEDMKPQEVASDSEELMLWEAPRRSASVGCRIPCRQGRGHGGCEISTKPGEGSALERNETRQKATAKYLGRCPNQIFLFRFIMLQRC